MLAELFHVSPRTIGNAQESPAAGTGGLPPHACDQPVQRSRAPRWHRWTPETRHTDIATLNLYGSLPRNLATKVPKSAQPWVATLVRTIFEQPDADAVRAQHAHVVTALEAKFPAAAAHLDDARGDMLAFTAFPREIWRQIWSNNPQERLNKEIRRRTDVVGIFPDREPSSAFRRRPGRAERRMDRSPPLHGPRIPRRLPQAGKGEAGKPAILA